jgi:hypothetical protein
MNEALEFVLSHAEVSQLETTPSRDKVRVADHLHRRSLAGREGVIENVHHATAKCHYLGKGMDFAANITDPHDLAGFDAKLLCTYFSRKPLKREGTGPGQERYNLGCAARLRPLSRIQASEVFGYS